jgi:hypothetical protein
MINQLKVFFHLFVLEAIEAMRINYTNTLIPRLDLKEVECLVTP